MTRGFLPHSIVIALISLVLSSCGGTSTSGTGGGTGTGGEPVTPTLTISLVDSSGNQISRIDGSEAATVVAQVTNGTGNSIITFSTTIGQLNPSSGTALTDTSGRATIDLEAGTLAGAGEVSATASINGSTIASNIVAFEVLPFDVVEEGLQIGTCSGGANGLDCGAGTTFNPGDLYIADSQISARGTTTVGVVVQNSSGDLVEDISINFSSRCTSLDEGGEPLASIGAGESNASGVVQVTYQASGCEGNDNITATEPSSGEDATGVINVLSPIIGSIVFDSVQDSLGNAIDTIFIQESGGESTARVIFQLLDRFGDPVDGEEVSFEFAATGEQTGVGGISLQTPTARTDDEGFATAFVNSGFIATTVRVRASLAVDTDSPPDGVKETTLVTLSDRLSVNTGIADQNSMSISTPAFNIEGESYDGIETTIRIKMADAFNNPVPDGTTVQFRTEYGRVDPNCNTVGGDCEVTWNSQEPRRPLDPNVYVPALPPVGDAQCPRALISEESMTISGTDGDTEYNVKEVHRVETTADVALSEGTDYTVDSDGSGITCLGGSCTDGTTLKITYDRLWLDEDDSGDTTHTISNPGVATPPYYGIQGVPCLAASRARTTTEPAYFGDLGQVYGGRSTVLAFAQGEESFTDTNANGIYDFGEPFVDLPEAFLDVNEDGVFGNGDPTVDDSRNLANPKCYGPVAPLAANNPAELDECYQEGGDEDIFIDFNNDGLFNSGNGIYNGTLCPKAISDRTDTCNNNVPRNGVAADPCDEATERYCTRDLVNIRRSIVILSAGSGAHIAARDTSTGEYISTVDLSGDPASGTFDANVDITANDGSTIAAGTDFTIGHGDSQAPVGIGEVVPLRSGSGSIWVEFSDEFSGRMPVDTPVSVTSAACELQNSPNTQVVSSSAFGFTRIFLSLGVPASPPADSGPVTVSVTSPQNNLSELALNCRIN